MSQRYRAALMALRDELRRELTGHILPWWAESAVDEARGGFFGYIDGHGVPDPDAPKGAVLNARILWAFSAAAAFLGDASLRELADRAAEYFRSRFLDVEAGGAYWMLDADGEPLDDRKHVYAQAFAIQALAEHFLAAHDGTSLAEAVAVFRTLEAHAVDGRYGGYLEAFTRSWVPTDDVPLGERDAHAPRTTSTHMHLLEAYTTLHRAWPDAFLRGRIRGLIELFLDRVVDAAGGHLVQRFDDDWTPRSSDVSFGHDIQASWLLLDAADAVRDDLLRQRVRGASLALARRVVEEGLDGNGGIYAGASPERGEVDTDKEWWAQAEALVGFVTAHLESGETRFLAAAWSTWTFVRRCIVDTEGGEWRRSVTRDGIPRRGHEKAGPWKGPYHDVRACIEVVRRVDTTRPAPARADAGAVGAWHRPQNAS